jgi:hypothetical protein
MSERPEADEPGPETEAETTDVTDTVGGGDAKDDTGADGEGQPET